MVKLTILWCLGLVLAIAVRAEPASRIAVRTVTGAMVSPLDGAGRKATVLLFVAHDCPVSNGYAPEFNRICKQYGPQGVKFFLVYVESDLSAAQAQAHVHDFGYTCTALLDPQHQLVKLSGTTVTPEAAVYTAAGKRVYRGRIDNQYAAIGQRREVVTRHDLRDALDAVLKGKPVAASETTAIGCFIPPPGR
jgi:thiol-disulfide isomerase/thioredoxin